MELLEGSTLFHKLYKEKSLLETTAAQYFRELVLAVEYLHSWKPPIVHRDIKPENILLDKDGRIKLIDFGWANYCESNKTPRFTVCGTIEYLSPEMIENKGHDTSTDIWCLGILLYEMLVGSTPFKTQEKDKMIKVISEGRVKYPLSIPPLAKDLISCMLEKNSEKRFDIYQVKNHRWLKEVKPIRETLKQSFLRTEFLLSYDDKKEQATDTTNNSDSDEDKSSKQKNFFGRKLKRNFGKKRNFERLGRKNFE